MTESVDRELGAISATLVAIQKELAEAKAAQVSMAEKQAAMSEKFDRTLGQVAELQREMKAIKPVVDELSRWKLLGLGAVMGIGAIGTATGLTIGLARDWVFQILGWK